MLPLDRQGMFEKRHAADRAQPPFALAALRHRTILAHRFAVMAEVNGDVKTRQRNASDNFIDVTKLGLFGAHKLASRRGIVKQIQHFQRGTNRMRRRFDGHLLIAPLGVGLPGLLLLRCAGSQRQSGNRADAGQRLAAKTEADNRFQVIERGNFTGGMTGQRQRQLVLFDPAAVIANADKLCAAALDININSRRASVETVFYQLLHHRRRTFHHLTCGNLVGELRR